MPLVTWAIQTTPPKNSEKSLVDSHTTVKFPSSKVSIVLNVIMAEGKNLKRHLEVIRLDWVELLRQGQHWLPSAQGPASTIKTPLGYKHLCVMCNNTQGERTYKHENVLGSWECALIRVSDSTFTLCVYYCVFNYYKIKWLPTECMKLV